MVGGVESSGSWFYKWRSGVSGRREGTGRGRCVRHVALREGLPVVQALVPFEPCQRLLFEDMLNVFACHRDRLAQLESVFERD